MASWFSAISVDNDDGFGSTAFAAFVQAVDTDSAWRLWWSRSAFEHLEVRPTPVDAPADRAVIASVMFG